MFREKRKFKNSKGLTLAAIYEGTKRDAPVVFICHGYQSSKDSESQEDLSKKLLQKGFSVYRFDFTACGESQGTIYQHTPNQGLDDLTSAIKDLGAKDFALYGSSYGGYVALRYAVQNPLLALILKVPASNWLGVKTDNKDLIKMIKFLKDTLPVNIYKKAANIKCPTLIVHGDADETVPLKQSEELLKSLGSDEKRLVVIKGAPHIMRGTYMEKAHSEIANFLEKTLF